MKPKFFNSIFLHRYLSTKRDTLHKPVLLKHLVSVLEENKFEIILDATFGGGGYSEAFLCTSHHPKVHALDIDSTVYKNAQVLRNIYGEKFTFKNIPFSQMSSLVELQNEKPNLIVFDLGISTDQVRY